MCDGSGVVGIGACMSFLGKLERRSNHRKKKRTYAKEAITCRLERAVEYDGGSRGHSEGRGDSLALADGVGESEKSHSRWRGRR